MYKKKMSILFSLLLILPFLVYAASKRKKGLKEIEQEEVVEQRYQIKEFITDDMSQVLSGKQVNDHKQLYVGYVVKRNEIDENLQLVDKSKSNQSYSTFRSLKVAETFTRNAAILHELYFENIAAGKKIGKETLQLVTDNFGSLKAFKDDLMATATAARGWAVMCYNLDDQRVQNYLLDAHNQFVPVMTIPLLVIDTYEHAYMIDFGINRKEYLAVLWNNINWDVVEERVKRFIVTK